MIGNRTIRHSIDEDDILTESYSDIFMMTEGIRKEEKLLKNFIFRHLLRWTKIGDEYGSSSSEDCDDDDDDK